MSRLPPAGAKGAVAAAFAALVLGPVRQRARSRTAVLADRLEDIRARLERLEESAAATDAHLSERITALDERQARAEAFATDLQRVIMGLAAQVASLSAPTTGSGALTQRVELVEKGVTELRDEAERAGVLAATAVAASDEVTMLVASLRELRRDLVQLAREHPPHATDNGQHPHP